jgi:hypothetical protein
LRPEDAQKLILVTRSKCDSAESLASDLNALKLRFSRLLASDEESTVKEVSGFFERFDIVLRRLGPLIDHLENNQADLQRLVLAADRDFRPAPPQAAWRGVREVLAGVRSLQAWTGRTRMLRPVQRSERPSAIEWLIGEGIPRIFERHFERPFGLAVRKGQPNSPGARFACGVLNAFGQRAYTIERMKQIRRKIRSRG